MTTPAHAELREVDPLAGWSEGVGLIGMVLA